MPPLACTVPVVCRKQCGWTGKPISALRPAVAIILLMANRLNCWPPTAQPWPGLGATENVTV
jgi:hypothetical protein